MNRKKVAYAGIVLCIIYFIVTFVLIVTGLKNWLIAMEIITMISGVFMPLLILALPVAESKKDCKTLSMVFVSACMIFTNIAHFVNLTVTAKLISNGVNMPDYFQIGKWPSVEMAIDYLGWGLFMGLAFLTAFLSMDKNQKYRMIKFTLLVCGILCIAGFIGAVLINENLWYIAPMGYGVGTIILCIELIFAEKEC